MSLRLDERAAADGHSIRLKMLAKKVRTDPRARRQLTHYILSAVIKTNRLQPNPLQNQQQIIGQTNRR